MERPQNKERFIIGMLRQKRRQIISSNGKMEMHRKGREQHSGKEFAAGIAGYDYLRFIVDMEYEAVFWRKLRKVNISHNLSQAMQYAEHIVILQDGSGLFDSPQKVWKKGRGSGRLCPAI